MQEQLFPQAFKPVDFQTLSKRIISVPSKRNNTVLLAAFNEYGMEHAEKWEEACKGVDVEKVHISIVDGSDTLYLYCGT